MASTRLVVAARILGKANREVLGVDNDSTGRAGDCDRIGGHVHIRHVLQQQEGSEQRGAQFFKPTESRGPGQVVAPGKTRRSLSPDRAIQATAACTPQA